MTRRRATMPCVVLAATALAFAGCDKQVEGQGDQPMTGTNSGSHAAPTRSGYADVHGARFYYQVYGDLDSQKTPLLVLHGSYMSSDAMAPFVDRFATSRPVIVFDARGHDRTGDLPGRITYDLLADDSAGVLEALKVPRADVLGYSMGGITALAMAVRHPERVGKQIILSGTSRRDGFYPEVSEVFKHVTPAAFSGTTFEAEYKRLSPTPNAFPLLVNKLQALSLSNYDRTDDAIRKIDEKTMIVVGDADAVDLAYAIELFKLRGGGDRKVAAQGFMPEAPRARLAILPATSHAGIMANADLIARLAVPFLDDVKPPMPPGFFKEHEK